MDFEEFKDVLAVLLCVAVALCWLAFSFGLAWRIFRLVVP